MAAVAVVISIAFLVYRLCAASAKVHLDQESSGSDRPPLVIPRHPLQHLEIDTCLQRGRFGQIWKGTLDREEVAVKVFSAAQRHHFLNEREIYSFPYMDHSSLLRFYGSDEREMDGVLQYMLVFSFVPLGSLCGYLKNNVVDWATLCKMCYSTASGLAHLHSDITKGGKIIIV